MQLEQIKQAVETAPKGANIVMEWLRPLKTNKAGKASNALLTKSVRMVGRIGIDYNNQQAVQDKRESGELPAELQPIWNGKGQWEQFPFLIRHVETGQRYLRLYRGTSDKVKPEVHFFMNGVEVAKETIAPLVLKSETESDHSDDLALTVKIEDLTRLNQESEWLTLVIANVGQEKVAVTSPLPAKVLATMQ